MKEIYTKLNGINLLINIEEKDDNLMVLITKTEAEEIRRRFPKAHIVRTMKQKSSRHRYYVEEARGVMAYLHRTRSGEPAEQKEGSAYGNRQKNKRVRPRLS